MSLHSRMTLRIMGVDPGGVSGWAIGEFTCESIFGPEPLFPRVEAGCLRMDYGQFTGDEDKQADDVIHVALADDVDVMVIEDFELRKLLKSKELLSPVRIGHKIAYGIHLANASGSRVDRPIRIEWQLPALAMSTATDERLRLWDISHRGQPHAKDGVRHVATFARRAKSEREIRKRVWS